MSRRAAVVGFLIVAVVVVFLAASRVGTDEARIASRIDQLLQAARVDTPQNQAERQQRIERAVGEVAAPLVVVHVPDFGPPRRGQAALARLLVEAGRGYDSAELSARDLSVVVARGDTATVQATIDATARRGSKQLTDSRNVRLTFSKAGDSWRLSGADVALKTHEEPEARP